jgi:hypothetical protein
MEPRLLNYFSPLTIFKLSAGKPVLEAQVLIDYMAELCMRQWC